MIEDKTKPPRPTPRDWAVFRYGLISEATRPLAGEVVAHTLDRIAAHQHQLPDGSLRRFSLATLRLWLRTYQHGGLDALVPKTRADKGSFRKIDDDTAEVMARHRVQHRELSVKLFHQILHQDGVLPAGVRVCEATLRRFLRSRGLDRPLREAARARAKYEMPHPNDLWVADFMHGPQVKTEQGKRKAILCAILDDHSRVAVGTRFALSEDTTDLLHAFRDAIATYGVPKRFYCDNGPAFSSRHLAEACARVGCSLLHSEPFDAPSRGKVERFFRTVRLRCLPLLRDDDLAGLERLQDRLDHWLRDDYHLKRHGGIGMKPLDRFLAGAEQTLITRLAPQEIDHAFMARMTRVVRQDATVKIDGTFYEVPPDFIGARVDLRFPVGRPQDIFLYRDDRPVGPVRPVDPVDNARFHAPAVEIASTNCINVAGEVFELDDEGIISFHRASRAAVLRRARPTPPGRRRGDPAVIEARFGLKRRPFDKAIATRDLYPWPGLEELAARLEMVKLSRGILLLTGEPGTGKTVALRRFVDSLNAEHYLPVYLPLATVTVIDAYAQLNRALGGQDVCAKSLLFREIQHGIVQLAGQGKQPVILLDEADLLRSPLFDELRILLNFEMDSKDPVLLILAGQPQLLAKLALRVHLPFRQRVAMRYRMPPMDETHTRGYVEHHLKLAGRKQRLFTDEALIQLFVQSGGIPRTIGNLALASMYHAAALNKDLVELDDVVAATKEVV